MKWRNSLPFNAGVMLRVSLRSLLFDRAKFAAAFSGVAFSTTLVVSQLGLYLGLAAACSDLVRYTGGDVWVMRRGTETIDFAEPLAPPSRFVVAEHPCVRTVRSVALAYVSLGVSSSETAILVGFEPGANRGLVPWNLVRGLPNDLHGPRRVTVDQSDLERFGLGEEPLGAEVLVNRTVSTVAAITSGIKSFTLSPYMFAEMQTVRALGGLEAGQGSFWVADLFDRNCASEVIRWIDRDSSLEALTTEDLRRRTESYWLSRSGAGAALGFGALVGLLVGSVVVAQTLFTTTKDHQRELATLKAFGAAPIEIVAFVLWQTVFLAVLGAAVGVALSFGARAACASKGLRLVLSADVIAISVSVVFLMCGLAAIVSVRKVLKLDAAEVFQ